MSNTRKKRKNKRFENALETAPFPIYEIDYKTPRFLRVNQATCKISGYTEQELLSMNPSELLDAESAERFKDRIKRGLAGRKIDASVEFKLKAKDGHDVWTVLQVKPTYKDGKLDSALVVAYDITERKKTEEALKASEDKYHSLFANLMDGFAYCQMIFDSQDKPIDFVYLEINDAFERLTGLKRENIVGRKVSEAIPGTQEANPEIFEVYGRVAKTRNPERFELFFKPLSIWLDIGVYSPGEGYFVAVFENITERKKAEEALRESEERWSTTLSSIGDAVIATDVEGNITFVNKVAQVLTGYSLAEAAQKPLQEIFHIVNEETRREVENPVAKVLKNGAITGLANHSVLIGKFGKEVPIDDSGSPIRDQSGKITGVVLVFHDISERKKAEAQLERQADLISIDPDAILVRKRDGTITFWSKGAEKLYGYTEQEALGQASNRLLATRFPAGSTLANILIQIQKSGDWSGELVHRTKGGREVAVRSHWVSRIGENDNLEFLESNVDVTDRVLLQEKLEDKASEVEEYATRMEELVEERTNRIKKQASLIDLSPDAIMVRGFDGTISFWSAGAEKLYRWTAKEAIGQVSHALLKTIFPVPLIEINAQIGVAGSWAGELRHKTKDGREVIVESSWLAEKNKAGRVIDILESNVDVTERKKAEEKLRGLSAYSRSLIEASVDPLVTISADGKITDANKAAEDVTGCLREELIGSNFSYYFTEPEKADAGYKKVFSDGFVRDYPLAIRSKSGQITEVLYNASVYRDEAGRVQGVFAAARDVTERNKAEAHAMESARRLKDTERLAAIGATAAMVGHDIRNPLQAITSDVYLAESELENLPDGEAKKNICESLRETEKNIDYINKIVSDLQDYARPLNPRAQESNIKTIVEEMIAKQKLSPEFKVAVDVDDDAQRIIADPDYLKRIISNLILNAIQAMPNGGKLTIRCNRDNKSGELLLTIQDTGVGIPDDVKDKVFEPMFTTKSKGQGFGLAVVKRMTEKLGGTVTFESKHGKGTRFIVRLPSPKK